MSYRTGLGGTILSATEAMQARNTNSIMQGWVDRGPWQYWDTLTLPRSATAALQQQYQPFSVPIGQQDPLASIASGTTVTKTKLQTNMTEGNKFPPPRCLLLEAIGFYFSSQWLKADMDKMLDSCWMELRIDDKIFHEGQLWQFPPGARMTGVDSVDGAWGLGVPAPFYMRRYGSWSKYIAPEQRFSMTINFGGGLVTVPSLSSGGTTTGAYPGVLVVFLDGLTDRSVQ